MFWHWWLPPAALGAPAVTVVQQAQGMWLQSYFKASCFAEVLIIPRDVTELQTPPPMGAQHQLLTKLYPGELHGLVEKYRLESGVRDAKSQWLPGLCDWKLQGPVSPHLGSTRW